MMKIFVAPVVLVTALLQLVVYCTDWEHIHLSLNGREIDERFKKIRYKMIKTVERSTSSAKKKNEGYYRLYISGNFNIKMKKDDYVLVLGDRRGAKEIAEIVSKRFANDAIVIVVFPKITQLASSFGFLEKFEEEIQKSHKDISIGREKIHFYFFLDEESKHLPDLFKLHLKEDRLISIAANKHLDFYSFCSGQWSNGVDSVSQVLINEADTVEIRLEAKCAEPATGLTVGGLTAQDLAAKLLGIFKADGQRHPYQTIRVRLPMVCSKDVNKRWEFTGNLINLLRGKLDVYGIEPSAEIHFASKDPPDHDFSKLAESFAKHKENSNIHQYIALLDENIVVTPLHQPFKNTALSDMKYLSIQVHCHGEFAFDKVVCGLNEAKLAEKLKSIIPEAISTIQIIFYACNVGTRKGQKYVSTLLGHLKGRNIQEVISFQSWTTQMESYDYNVSPMILVGLQDKYKATTLIDEQRMTEDSESLLYELDNAQVGKLLGRSENYAFGRFTTRIKIINNTYRSFPVLPKTELELY